RISRGRREGPRLEKNPRDLLGHRRTRGCAEGGVGYTWVESGTVQLNTPAFFAMLPDVRGLAGLDIGCGEGHNTRLLAKRGARVTAVDIAEVFVAYAQKEEAREPLGIDYRVASAVELPFAGAGFDFVTGFMSFMDVPEIDRVLAEAYRVLKPGGFLQFSITHP